MKNSLTCAHCGYVWKPIDPRDVKKSLEAARVNKQGPFCGLCRCLMDARNHADWRVMTIAKRTIDKLLKKLAVPKTAKRK